MKSILALLLVMATPAFAETDADKWEKSLQEKKADKTLPGPKPGQKCLWSERLKACLWYTPGKWDWHAPTERPR